MAWTATDAPSPILAIGTPEDGDKRLAFPPIPANQAGWWQDFAWWVRNEFARRCRIQSPHVATIKSVATGLDVNGIGMLQIIITTGSYEQITGSGGTGTFVVGEIIFTSAVGFGQATKAAIVTKVGGTTGAPILNYTLLAAPGTGLLTDFVSGDIVKGNTSAASCTAATPVNVFAPS